MVFLSRALDFETDPLLYVLHFNACDPFDLCTEPGNITIILEDVNDPPVIEQIGQAFIPENQVCEHLHITFICDIRRLS